MLSALHSRRGLSWPQMPLHLWWSDPQVSRAHWAWRTYRSWLCARLASLIHTASNLPATEVWRCQLCFPSLEHPLAKLFVARRSLRPFRWRPWMGTEWPSVFRNSTQGWGVQMPLLPLSWMASHLAASLVHFAWWFLPTSAARGGCVRWRRSESSSLRGRDLVGRRSSNNRMKPTALLATPASQRIRVNPCSSAARNPPPPPWPSPRPRPRRHRTAA